MAQMNWGGTGWCDGTIVSRLFLLCLSSVLWTACQWCVLHSQGTCAGLGWGLLQILRSFLNHHLRVYSLWAHRTEVPRLFLHPFKSLPPLYPLRPFSLPHAIFRPRCSTGPHYIPSRCWMCARTHTVCACKTEIDCTFHPM